MGSANPPTSGTTLSAPISNFNRTPVVGEYVYIFIVSNDNYYFTYCKVSEIKTTSIGTFAYLNVIQVGCMPTKISAFTNDAGYTTIESGSNDNGSWIKYSDGTMICRKTTDEINMNITTAWSSLYEGNVSLGNFPAEFIETPTISVIPFGSGMLIEQGGINASKTSWGNATCVRSNSAENVKARFYLTAIGNWK